jgi:hypothetical protein
MEGAMILMVLFTVVMLLWFLTILPFPPLQPFAAGGAFFNFLSVLLLGLYLFVPALRG